MGLVGSLGTLVFEVSDRRIQTFSELTEGTKGRWSTHETIGRSPLSEFLGPGQDEATFVIIFTPMLGVNPDVAYAQLRRLARAGEHFPVIIGGWLLSGAEWFVESVESKSAIFSPTMHTTMWRECTVSLKEYN